MYPSSTLNPGLVVTTNGTQTTAMIRSRMDSFKMRLQIPLYTQRMRHRQHYLLWQTSQLQGIIQRSVYELQKNIGSKTLLLFENFLNKNN